MVFHVGQQVRHHSNRWTPTGWEPIAEIGTVIDPCVKNDPNWAGTVEIKIDGILNRVFCNPDDLEPVETVDHATPLRALCSDIHARNVAAGWWHDLTTGERLDRNVGEMLCLIHSEISEAMEGHRKSLMDDKLPHRPMIEVELADAVIRIADLAGALGLDLGGAVVEKLAYNAQRADHKPENRAKPGGKAY